MLSNWVDFESKTQILMDDVYEAVEELLAESVSSAANEKSVNMIII